MKAEQHFTVWIPSRWPTSLRRAVHWFLTETVASRAFAGVREANFLPLTSVTLLPPSAKAPTGVPRAPLSASVDAYAWERRGDQFVVRAANPRSAAFAVFDIARRRGVRWLTPQRAPQYVADWAEPIPAKCCWQAAFPATAWWLGARSAHGLGLPDDIARECRWLLFHHWNTLHIGRIDLPPALIDFVHSFGLQTEVGTHCLQQAMPRRLFEERPDFFPVVRGGRTKELGDFALANPEAAEVVRQNAAAIFRRLRKADALHFWYDDVWFGSEDESTNARWSPTRRAAELLRQVSGLHRKLAANQRLITLAYNKQLVPDPTAKFDPHVEILFCPRERCQAHPLHGPRACGRNHEMAALLRRWIDTVGAERVRFLDYSLDHFLRVSTWGAHPSVETLVEDVRFLARLNLCALNTLYFPDYSDVEAALLTTTLAQVVARPWDCDPAGIRAEYFRLAFGEYAIEARTLFDLYAPLQSEFLRYDDYRGTKRDMRFPGLDQTEPSLRHARRLDHALRKDGAALRRRLDALRPPELTTAGGRELYRMVQNLRFSLDEFSIAAQMLRGVPYIRGEKRGAPHRNAWLRARADLKQLRVRTENAHADPFAGGSWSKDWLACWSRQMEHCLQFGKVEERD